MFFIQQVESELAFALKPVVEEHQKTVVPDKSQREYVSPLPISVVQSILINSNFNISMMPQNLVWLLDGLSTWCLGRNMYRFDEAILDKISAISLRPSAATLTEPASLAFDVQQRGNARYVELSDEMAAGLSGYKGFLLWHYKDNATRGNCLVQSWFNGIVEQTKTFVIPLQEKLSIGECIVWSRDYTNGVECHSDEAATDDERLVLFGMLTQIACGQYNIFGVTRLSYFPRSYAGGVREWTVEFGEHCPTKNFWEE